MHQCLNDRAPEYLAVYCVQLRIQRYLRSSERNLLLHVPRHQLSTYGRQAVAISGPSAWIILDPICNSNATEAVFRRLLSIFVRTVL